MSSSIQELFSGSVKAVNLGIKGFYNDLSGAGIPCINLDWKPPAGGDRKLLAALDMLEDNPDIDAANAKALGIINSASPVLTGIGRAIDVIPGMTDNLILHAGPPITWERMSGPLRGAVAGALIYEGDAGSYEEAEQLAQSGKIKFSPCHEHSAVGPMAGVVSKSMPVFIVENRAYQNRAYCTLNEGLGKVLRFGAYGGEVTERLRWMADVLAPGLKKAIELSGGIDLKGLIAQALHMGDEVHNRNKAATSLFIREILPYLAEAGLPKDEFSSIVKFINSNDHFFLNLSMPASKATLDAAGGIVNSTVVTVMARNGTDFGIKVSGMPGRWFTGPALDVEGLLFPGFKPEDRNPDMGDSAITETCGLGGFSMASALAIVQFVGGAPSDAVGYSSRMYEITAGKSNAYTIPILDFQGSATGIDIRKVVATGIMPQINTGIASKNAGVGQVGAGLVTPPWECFSSAVTAMAEMLKC